MQITYISTYAPRQCGIATFSQNLVNAVAANQENSSHNSQIVNIDYQITEGDYPPEVKFSIRQDFREDYIKAAEYINQNGTDICFCNTNSAFLAGTQGFLFCLLFMP